MAAAIPSEKKVFDYAYNASSAAKYHLSVQINQNSFLFVLIHITENKAIGFGKYHFPTPPKKELYEAGLKDWLRNPMFSLPFQSVSVFYSGRYSTLIPSGLFDEANSADFMRFNFRLENDSSAKSNKINALSAHVAFSCPNAVLNLLNGKFVNYSLKHSSTSSISYFMEFLKSSNSPTVLLDIHTDFFALLVGEKKGLLLYNSFPRSNAEDIMYFLLYSLEKLEIDNEETAVLLCGETNALSVEHGLLQKYFKSIRFLEKLEGLNISLKLREFQTPEHFKLFNQYLCE